MPIHFFLHHSILNKSINARQDFQLTADSLQENISWSVTSLSWTVQTTKNLTFSPMFYLCLFIYGETTSEANSHFFNISNPDASSTTSSSTITQGLTTTPVQLTLPTTTVSTPPASSQTTLQPTDTATIIQPAEASTSGLSTGAKAGIGIGVSVPWVSDSRACFSSGGDEKPI